MLPGDQFLRIVEFETLRKDVAIGHSAEAGQGRPDLARDGIIAVAMPAQNQLGLLPEVSEIRHGRNYG
jgi:hypothetical protein